MALEFTAASSQGVRTAQNLLSAAGSYSIWFKASVSQEADARLFSDYGGYCFLTLGSSVYYRLVFGIYDGAGRLTYSDTTLNDNTLHHAVATWNGSNMYLYVDGIQHDTTNSGSPLVLTNYIDIGYRGGLDNFNWDGTAFDARIYNRVLSVAEIQAIYSPQTRGIDNIVNGLVGRWLMNELSSGSVATGAGSVKDISPAGNHGTAVNSPQYSTSPMRLYKPQLII